MVGAFMLFSALAWALGKAQQGANAEAWAEAAKRLGLSYAPGGLFASPMIKGTRQGMWVTIDTASEGSGDKRKTVTRYQVTFPRPLGLGLDIRPEGFLSNLGKLFGATDIEVGDREFDASVAVRGSAADRVRAYLTTARRVRIQRLLRTYESARLSDDGIFMTTSGTTSDPDYLVRLVDYLVALAQHLEAQRRVDHKLDKSVAQREAGELGPALDTLQQARREAGGDSDLRAQEGEVLYTAGRYEQAAEAFADAGKALPEDREVADWAEQATEVASSQRTAPKPPAPGVSAKAAGPTPADLCSALFAPGVSSLDVTRLFEERFKGRSIRWTGTLRWVDTAAFDFHLGFAPGGRAIVEVCAVTPGLAGGRAVKALLSLPEGDTAGLKARIGGPVTFEGRLASVDAFARNLYVSDARLVS